MSVKRKLFLSMAAGIIGMALLYVFLTMAVVTGILRGTLLAGSEERAAAWSEHFASYYAANGQSWSGVQAAAEDLPNAQESGASFLLASMEGGTLAAGGEAHEELVRRLGVRKPILIQGVAVAVFYYLDPILADRGIARLGISSSVTVLLLAGAILLVLLALLVAHAVSRRLTAPLQSILPAIDRLGKGEYGVQAPVLSRDEYGMVAGAFNAMSAQLKQAEEVRRNLTADVSHELRTPLTIIRGKLEWLQQQGRPVEPESLLPLQDELIRLTALVDDLQQLSLAEAKKLPLTRQPASVAALLRRVIARMEPDAEEKGIAVTLICDAEPPPIEIDSRRMAQVFLNLLGNAIRYTPAGGSVTVHVSESAPGGERPMLQVSFADTGPGIAPEHLPYLFERFYRTDEARSREHGGMGLGLAIAKQFVLTHDGSIEARSQVGLGTTIIVRLPL